MRSRLAVALALLLTALTVIPATGSSVETVLRRRARPTGRSARTRPALCRPTHEEVQARSGASVLFLRETGPFDGKYGAPSALFGCTRLRQRPVRISSYDEFTGPHLRLASIAGFYAAYVEEDDSLTCSAYGEEACEALALFFESVDLRTGRVRAGPTNGEPSALVVTRRGWLSWVAGAGSRSPGVLFARDSSGRCTLDSGPVTASSVHVAGDAIEWTDSTGNARTATLR